MSKNLVKKWVVVQIKPNSHDMALRNLERQGFETFLPKMKSTIRKQKKFIYKDKFVFPGYMFVGIDQQISDWNRINSTYGVSKLLAFNNKPAEISHELVFALKHRYEANFSPFIKENLKKGDIIKFNSGPFVDLIARIEAVDDKNRLWLLLEEGELYRKLKIQQTEKINFTKVKY